MDARPHEKRALSAGLSNFSLTGMLSAVFIAAMTVAAILGPSLLSGDPFQISSNVLAPPSSEAWLGTDELGRDIFHQLVIGIRVSLLTGFSAALAACVLGIGIGASAGYLGGAYDNVIMRVTEAFQVMPAFILAALIVAMVGPGLPQIVLVIAILSWPQPARVIRADVHRWKRREFVDAARCLGVSETRILFGELVPNCIGPVLAVGTLLIAQAILLEASLSYFGLGSQEIVSWGKLLNSGQRFFSHAWWLSVFPGAAIFATVVAFNIFGDDLRKCIG
jgi:peptide/nickel transport system permease protein